MVDFLRKRLQVFVSSTYSDLRQERQSAVEAILVAGHIPAGMELFTSGDQSQMDVINQWIDESDVYLLILGGRYGSIEPKSGKSYTQLEYEYAIRRKKPIFACVINESAIEARVRTNGTQALETQNPKELQAFRSIVLSRMVRFWDDYKDIKISIGETLATLARRDDLVGWVRPSTQVDVPVLAGEMARLSIENSQLRHRTGGRQSPLLAGMLLEKPLAFLKKNKLEAYLIENGDALVSDSGLTELDETRRNELVNAGIVAPHRHRVGAIVITEYGRLILDSLPKSPNHD